jgi:hypothetical protein
MKTKLKTRYLLARWLLPDSNWGHKALQASALPAELKSHITLFYYRYTPKSNPLSICVKKRGVIIVKLT